MMTNPLQNLHKRFAPGSTVSGFTVLRLEDLPDVGMAAAELRHKQSGARMLHLAADDPENLFAVAFRTPPPDDTGLPHILEHTVLCGSQRYPVKDPFVELLKTSLATFLNAMTYPDRTVYPCSSMNPADYRNLLRVYADAVFFPILSEDHFRQEGHHLEFTPEGKLSIKGIVYNEMRGVYSDPEGILDRHIQHLLFASNAYGRDFGGDPAVIPSLTYADFVKFHQTYCHPSNAWIFTYGNIDPLGTMELLDKEYLSKFQQIELDTAIKTLERWQEPHHAEFPYPLDKNDDPGRKTDISLAWAANDRRDLLTTLAMKVIDGYLLDNSASPLRKDLIDSRLGEELGSSGYADYQRDTFFAVTLKGSEKESADAMERLCLETIRREAENGFDKEKVASSLRQLELSAREIRPQYPLRLIDLVYTSWLYDSDPLSQLRVSQRLDELRHIIETRPGYLENLALEQLADNQHRLRVVLVPDSGYVERKDREQNQLLCAMLDAMSDATRSEVRKTAERLEEMQSEGNSPEALATLPRLALSDVSPDPIPLECHVEQAGGFDILDVPAYSGGVGYLQLCLDLGYLEDEYVDYLPLFAETLGKCGAAGLDYAAMAEREAAAVGGLEFSAGITSHIAGPDRARLRLTGWIKALDGEWDKGLGVLADRLFQPDFTDKERLRDIILQSRMAWRNQVVPAGNAYAALYAGRSLSKAMALSERLSGCSQARFVDRLASDLDGCLDQVIRRFDAMHALILGQARLYASQVGSKAAFAATKAWLNANAVCFARRAQSLVPPEPVAAGSVRIGLAAPADVAYVARVLPGPAVSSPEAPALLLLGLQLSYGYLWNEIRVKGGAYSARAAFDGARGVFQFSSFRDPAIAGTLSVYDGVPAYIRQDMDLSPSGLEQAIIGTVKSLDQPVRPSSAAALALARWLGGETEEFRKDFRSRLLALQASDIRHAAGAVFANLASAPVCALSSREKLTAENRNGANLQIEPLWDAGAKPDGE